ncbi:MAG TPA: hypothetical protein VLH40_08090 [Atribacteraceae bacterium]|nr:hypothetical protein [Atribacteraceae bacterium]
MERSTLVFSEGGPQHLDLVLDKCSRVIREEGINHLVVATGGETLLRAARLLRSDIAGGLNLVGVTLQAGTWVEYGEPNWDKLAEAKNLGAQVLTCTHSLMGNVESAIVRKFGGVPPVELIAYTLYAFSQGTKVAVEVMLSAVDAGMLPSGVPVIGVGGTGEGADTALLMRAVSTVDFFDLKIHEILCKPR